MSGTNVLKFINHASILIKGTRKALLSDPWYFGDAFNHAWRLLYENDPAAIAQVLDETTHIWISHEHPDHLSIEFLKTFKDQILARGITFLFQKTKDRRVASYLQKNGFSVFEAESGETIELEPGFLIKIVKDEFYDSACLAVVDGVRIFNINDCPIRAVDKLEQFRKIYGTCDILLTQFSYAAWKGGRENKAWREEAAREKIVAVRNQATAFQAKVVIPFASFVWFSNTENFYLCDSVNIPADVVKQYEHEAFKTMFMQPYETLDLKAWKEPDPASVAFWQAQYGALSLERCSTYTESYTVEQLQDFFATYCTRLEQDNSWLLIKMLSRIPGLGAFQPVTIRLIDHNSCVTVDVANKTLLASSIQPDMALHSYSVAFLFNNPFGFDTLTVNGCLEEVKPGGFTRFAKALALENMNNIGLYLGVSLLSNLDVVKLFATRLVAVSKKMLKV